MNYFKKLFKGKRLEKPTPIASNLDFKRISKSDYFSFSDLLEQNAVLSYEKQLNFGEIIGSNSWQFDMSKGEISFGEDLVFPVQIIGSISFEDNSWMWGWANKQSGIPEHLLVLSNKLKAIGEQKNIEELKNSHFKVNGKFDHQVGMIASGLFKTKCYYSANYGKGSLVCTIDSPKIATPTSDPFKALTTFTQFIADFELSHKESFKNYLIDKDYSVKTDKNYIFGLKGDSILKAEFDTLDRLCSIKNT